MFNDYFLPIGTILKLIHPIARNKTKLGCRAIVVDGKKEYPNLYNELQKNISHEDLDYFVGVVWDKNDPNYFGALDGFYMVERFGIDEDQTNFLQEQLKNLTNNENRKTCFKCGEQTQKVMGFNNYYTICPKCQI